jgi:hypothetical protein
MMNVLAAHLPQQIANSFDLRPSAADEKVGAPLEGFMGIPTAQILDGIDREQNLVCEVCSIPYGSYELIPVKLPGKIGDEVVEPQLLPVAGSPSAMEHRTNGGDSRAEGDEDAIASRHFVQDEGSARPGKP